MSSSPNKSTHNVYVLDNNSDWVVEPGSPQPLPTPQSYSAFGSHELSQAGEILSTDWQRLSHPSGLFWGGDSGANDAGFYHPFTPLATRRQRSPVRKNIRRQTPYPAPAKASGLGTSATSTIRPSAVGAATFEAWDADFRAEIEFSPFRPHRPDVSNDEDDLFWGLAASAATFSTPISTSDSRGEQSSSSSAAPATPPGAAGDGNAGDSGNANQGGEEPQPDMAVVPNPAVLATNLVHSQQGAASGVAAVVGSAIIHLPANRDALLDRLQGGMHIQSAFPSSKNTNGMIICMAKQYLQRDGTFQLHDEVCGKLSSTGDIYGRHIKEKHLQLKKRGSHDMKKWIRKYRPGAIIQRENRNFVVLGGRPSEQAGSSNPGANVGKPASIRI